MSPDLTTYCFLHELAEQRQCVSMAQLYGYPAQGFSYLQIKFLLIIMVLKKDSAV